MRSLHYIAVHLCGHFSCACISVLGAYLPVVRTLRGTLVLRALVTLRWGDARPKSLSAALGGLPPCAPCGGHYLCAPLAKHSAPAALAALPAGVPYVRCPALPWLPLNLFAAAFPPVDPPVAPLSGP